MVCLHFCSTLLRFGEFFPSQKVKVSWKNKITNVTYNLRLVAPLQPCYEVDCTFLLLCASVSLHVCNSVCLQFTQQLKWELH